MIKLIEFAAGKIRDYSEPQRKGTPRGDRIGLSNKKYACSVMLGLIKLQKKKLAETLEVSYGLLRKWWTEDTFKEVARQAAKEYAYMLVDEITLKLEADYEACDDFPKKEIPEAVDFDEYLREAHKFSSMLNEEINELLIKRLKKAVPYKKDWGVNALIHAQFFPKKEDRAFVLYMLKTMATSTLQRLLSKKVIGPEEQRLIEFLLEAIKKFL